MADSVYDFKCTNILGEEVSMEQFKGKVLLIVNTASKCGFTPQYESLQTLYSELKDSGLEILGFPCNQFANQEKENESAISEFCTLNYGVGFPMFAKVDVNGAEALPLFDYLKEKAPGLLGSKAVKWNFTKFLVDQSGQVVRRYAPNKDPKSFAQDIKQLLAKS